MPLFLIAVAAVFLIAAVRGTLTAKDSSHPGLLNLLQGDFIGQNNYLIWIGAIGLIGSVGYIKVLQPVANAMLVLVLLVLFLSHKGFFEQFTSAVLTTQSATTGTSTTGLPGPLKV